MNQKVVLQPKTNKAKNKLREAGTNEWEVIRTSPEVFFSPRQGPWHYVRPTHNNHDTKDYCRWVSEADDPDFTLVFKGE